MNKSVTSSTYIRHLSYSSLRRLSDFLDPHGHWRDVIVSIRKPSGELRYSQHHVRRFEGLAAQGRSPTVELLLDWGTSNCTVGELVDILKSHKFLAAASVLLPEEEATPPPAELQQASPSLHTYSSAPTMPLVEPRTQALSITTVPQQESSAQAHAGVSTFSYNELMRATGNFDDCSVSDGGCRLGEGGFGTVYKGVLNNKPVAVKKLNPMDDISLDELRIQFNQEVETLKVLKHENLVDMVGYSCDGQYPCLVYPLMANGSLLDRLACLDGSPALTWQQRCEIAEGTARGLEYLHSSHHVHRDVKSANILLDETFVAKISDFGLTRASAQRTSTTVKTERIIGTSAYMAPEALRGEITPKSDIFSFGVVLLEILSGLPPVDNDREPSMLMDIRYDIDEEDEGLTLDGFLDKKMGAVELSQADSVYTLASSCLHDRKNRRPVIKQVLLELKGVVKSISLD